MDKKNKFGDFEIDQTLLTPLTFDEPELHDFDVADVFEPVTEVKQKKRFGKRSERRAEVKVKTYDAFEEVAPGYNEPIQTTQAQGTLLEQMTLSDDFGKETAEVHESADENAIAEKETVVEDRVDSEKENEEPIVEEVAEETIESKEENKEPVVEVDSIDDEADTDQQPMIETEAVVEETVEDENSLDSTMEMKPLLQDEEESIEVDFSEDVEQDIPLEEDESDVDDVVFPVDKEDDDEYDEDDLLYEKKSFLISDYEKKENYLKKQSKEGYHLVRVSGRTYYFREGPEKNYYYNYAYFKKEPTDEMWNEWEKDGWKLICRQQGKKKRDAGWYIFRNEEIMGEYPKFIDNDLEKFNFFKKEVSSYRSTQFLLFLCLVVCIGSAYLQYYFNGFLIGIAACGVVGLIALIYWLRYGKLARRSNKRKKQLKSRLRVKQTEEIVSQNEKDEDEDWDTLEDVLNDKKKNKKRKK